jgi:hypothetical protein
MSNSDVISCFFCVFTDLNASKNSARLFDWSLLRSITAIHKQHTCDDNFYYRCSSGDGAFHKIVR